MSFQVPSLICYSSSGHDRPPESVRAEILDGFAPEGFDSHSCRCERLAEINSPIRKTSDASGASHLALLIPDTICAAAPQHYRWPAASAVASALYEIGKRIMPIATRRLDEADKPSVEMSLSMIWAGTGARVRVSQL